MSKNVAVFVDVANIFYAAKAAGVDIDYVTLLKSATAGRDFVRAYAYTGLDPENENQRQFHSFLARSGYKVVSKDIRKYGDGRIKANLDIELVVDMMRIAQHIDIAVVVSGDGDFAPAIRAVQQLGVRCEVISFRGNTSSDLIEVADVFTDITQIARVEKGARSGRRVAADDDLSMTEVPDKETEGGARRRRGGRRVAERPEREERGGRIPVAASAEASGSMPGNLIVLPGEKLSRAVGDDGEEPLDLEEIAEEILAEQSQDEAGLLDADGRRRRRRRGGRGRGRGRRPESESENGAVGETVGEAVGEIVGENLGESFAEDEEYLDEEIAPLPQHSTFGSVWDSQIGVPSTPVGATPSTVDDLEDEDLEDEPEIPEYLLAERRQQGQNRGRGGANRMGRPQQGRRGGAGYQSAVDNVRYGRSGTSAFGGGGGSGGGMSRMPDRNRAPMGGNRGPRPQPQQSRPRPSYVQPPREVERPERPVSSEPWSEVPPEVQEMLRAELARRQAPASPVREAAPSTTAPVSARPARGRAPSTRAPRDATAPAAASSSETSSASAESSSVGTAPAETAAPRRRTATRSSATRSMASATADTAPTADAGTPAPKARRGRTAAGSADAGAAAAGSGETAAAKPRRTATRRSTSAASASTASGTASGAGDTAEAKPKRRTSRVTAAASTEPASEA